LSEHARDWKSLFRADGGTINRGTSNLPDAGDGEPRRDESSDFRFPTVRFDSARRTFFASSGDGEVIPVARFRQDPAFEWPELAPGAKIFLLIKNGHVTATFTATNYRRAGILTVCAQFLRPIVETKSTISESTLRKSFRRPFSGFNLRLRTIIVRSRIWCSISRGTCSIGPYDLSTARQTNRSFSSGAMYALAIVRKSRCSERSSDSSIVTGDESRRV